MDAARARRFVLVDLDRRVVTAAALAPVFLAVVAAGAVDPGLAGDPVETLFQALVTATVTGVTLVVTINQLVLSQELGAVGDQRERMAGAEEFRDDVARVVDDPAPPTDPGPFLAALAAAAGGRAAALAATVGGPDDEARAETAAFAASLRDAAADAERALGDVRFGEFAVLDAALGFDYSWRLHEARRLRNAHADRLSAETRAAVDDVAEALALYGAAREHVKTLYFQWALVDLSRSVLYAAVPALAVASVMVLFVDPETVTGTTLGLSHLAVLVALAACVSLLPFALLFAHVLRIATVAKHTLAVGPFALRDVDRPADR